MKFRSLALSLLVSATPLLAKTSDAASTRTVTRLEIPLLATLDTDRDRMLSPAEIAAAPGRLQVLDLDEDGSLSPAEYRVTSGGRPAFMGVSFAGAASGSRPAPGFLLFYALDVNQDGTLQPLEIVHAASSLARLDTNRDGALSVDELRLGRPRVLAVK